MPRIFDKRTISVLVVSQFILSLLPINVSAAVDTQKSSSQTTITSQDVANLPTSKTNEVVVLGKLDQARDSIVPSLGATQYDISSENLDVQSQGQDAGFNQVILRAPGVVEDSFGQLHVRGEHANLQYRINDVLIPEGITGFGSELDTRFADKVSLITGALPAQFGYRTSGIVDIHTKSGAFNKGGEISTYGGSYDTIKPSFEYGGSEGKLNYFFNGSYLHNALGIENPADRAYAIHDKTNQYKGFGYLSYLIDDTSRVSLFSGMSYANFQIPNNPNQDTAFGLTGVDNFASWDLNERQREQNYFGVLAYQKTLGDLNVQVAGFTRYSGVNFRPDENGDLMFNGIASRADRGIYTNGLELDSSYALNDKHTIRAGSLLSISNPSASTTSLVFPTDDAGNQISTDPFAIIDRSKREATLYGFYLQDEWKVFEPVTINFGGRFDHFNQYVSENQVSPRVNVTYKPFKKTSLHAGYARYFTPPPAELVQNVDPTEFNNTTNAAEVTENTAARSERAHYVDAGITQEILPGLSTGVDAYYKWVHNMLDEGQFGAALINSAFNYNRGRIYGLEISTSYKKYGFDIYNNVALNSAKGQTINSGQFEFGQDELDYIKNNWVHLDHEQDVTISNGISYTWKGTKVFADMLYGSGLRRDFANTGRIKRYYPINVGFQQSFKVPHMNGFKLRFDVVNIFNQHYQLRDGSGIGVGAPQFGQRRGIYAGISYEI